MDPTTIDQTASEGRSLTEPSFVRSGVPVLPGEFLDDCEKTPVSAVHRAAAGTKIDGVAVRASRVLRSKLELSSLAALWENAGAASPMQQLIWTRAAAESFSDDYELRVVTAGDAIAPFAQLRRGLARLELLGVTELYEPMDCLYRDENSAARLAEAIAGMHVPLRLRRVPADSLMIGALKRSYRGRGMVIVRPVAGYPWIPLEDGWDEPERKFNAGRRSDFRRMMKRAENIGPVSFEVHTPLPAQLDPLLDEAFRVEAASWKGKLGTALACDARIGSYYRLYAAEACRKGILRVCLMRAGDDAIAMQLVAECGGRWWLLKIGHDERHSKCSPGTLLMLHTLEHAARRGLATCEFLGTTESWTAMWSTLERKCVSLRAYPFRPMGIVTLAADVAKNSWPMIVSRFKGKS